MSETISIKYEPQAKQRLLHETTATFILYGGAAGGGKSKCLRMDNIAWCLQIPGLQAYLFRRTLPELEDNHIRFIKEEIPAQIGSYNETKHILTFTNKSAIHFCFAQRDDDIRQHQGAEMHVLAVDEAALMSEFQLGYLMTRNRLGGFLEKVPEKFRHLLPRAAYGSNPGGPGHHWLKANFIDMAPAMTLFQHPDYRRKSIFIPARMDDNAYIDKGYENTFVGLPLEYARALREGNWESVVGQALPIVRTSHMCEPFAIPRHWTRFMSMDWGVARPFAVCWFAVSDGSIMPKGTVVLYREWYGWNGQRNTGCRLPAVDVGAKILEIERSVGETMDYRIADSSMWSSQDGPSPAEAMMVGNDGLLLRSTGRKDRTALYANFLAYLSDPLFKAFSTCTQFWRTVPVLVMDRNAPEKGYDSDQEDHIADAVGYGLFSRPFVSTTTDRMYQDDPDLRKSHLARLARVKYPNKRSRGGDPYRT